MSLDKLTAPDGAQGDLFGDSLALSNSRILVGSVLDDDNGTGSGSAYLYSSSGSFLQKLTAPDGTPGDRFGDSVALSGGFAVVGSPDNDILGLSSGSVYVYDAATGGFQANYFATDGSPGDQFGHAIAMSGTTALVSSVRDDDNGMDSGSAYLFDVVTSQLFHKFIAPDGSPGDFFGDSVALSANYAVVGSPFEDSNGTNSGAAYLFDVNTGDLLHKLTPNDGSADDLFGESVAVSNGLVLVGSPQDDDDGQNSGSAYLFDAVTGQQIRKLTAPDAEAIRFFALSIGFFGNNAVIGSSTDDDNGPSSGSAYVFDVNTGQLIEKLTAPDGAVGDTFGESVTISSGAVLIGSPRDDDQGPDSGSVYLFGIPEPTSATLAAAVLAVLAASVRSRETT